MKSLIETINEQNESKNSNVIKYWNTDVADPYIWDNDNFFENTESRNFIVRDLFLNTLIEAYEELGLNRYNDVLEELKKLKEMIK